MQQTKNCLSDVILCQSECWSWISLPCDGCNSRCIPLSIDWNGFCDGTRGRRHSFKCTPWGRRSTQEGEGGKECLECGPKHLPSGSYIVLCTHAVHVHEQHTYQSNSGCTRYSAMNNLVVTFSIPMPTPLVRSSWWTIHRLLNVSLQWLC